MHSIDKLIEKRFCERMDEERAEQVAFEALRIDGSDRMHIEHELAVSRARTAQARYLDALIERERLLHAGEFKQHVRR